MRLHPSTRFRLLFRLPKAVTAAGSSGWHGSLSRLSSVRLKSPTIVSGFRWGFALIFSLRVSQNFSLAFESFGA